MLIITDADTDKKKTNSLIPIPIRGKKFTNTDADMNKNEIAFLRGASWVDLT